MDVMIKPHRLSGSAEAIPSKSDLHRALICAALSDTKTVISASSHISEDIEATMRCLISLGADIRLEEGRITVIPIKKTPENPLLDCGESGSTLRFLIPVAAHLVDGVSFRGSERLMARPIEGMLDAISKNGVSFKKHEDYISAKGKLENGSFEIPGDISSQYVTGLLLTLPLLGSESEIILTAPLQSASYIDITVTVMKKFGVKVIKTPNGYKTKGHFTSPGIYNTEGDWSNAAFFLAGGAIGGTIKITGLDIMSAQGDKEILGLLAGSGADVFYKNNDLTIKRRENIGGKTIDISDIPDLLPILAVMASFAGKPTTFMNASRLRYKESDRLETVNIMLCSLGGRSEVTEDTIKVFAQKPTGGTVNSFGDHRIAMAAAIAASYCKREVLIINACAVNKSYPDFFEDYRKLGGIADVI